MSSRVATTTFASAGVALSELADHLIALVLRPRETILKHQAPKSRYAKQLIRDCRRRHAKPMHMLVALSMEDVESSRIPIGEITRPYENLIALLQQRRKEVEVQGVRAPSLLPLMIRESRAQVALDEAQLRVSESPDDPEALEELLERSAQYDDAQERMVAAARDRLAAIRNRNSRSLSAPFERVTRRAPRKERTL